MILNIKPKFVFNNAGIKESCYQYRNIKGIHYICWTSDMDIFEEEIEKAKKLKLRTKIIKGELYIEKK